MADMIFTPSDVLSLVEYGKRRGFVAGVVTVVAVQYGRRVYRAYKHLKEIEAK